MTTTLANVIESARLRHPSFDSSRVPDPLFASWMSAYQNELIGKALERDKTYCGTSQTVSVTDALFDDGEALSEHVAVLGGSVIYTDDSETPEELHFTTFERRFDPPEFPAVYLMSGTLRLAGRREDWTDIASVVIHYIPITAALTALTSTFAVPDAARTTLIARAAMEAAIRCAALGESVDVKLFATLYDAAESSYLRTLRLSKRARHTVIRPGDYY